MEDAAEGEQVGLGQFIREEVAGDDLDSIGHRRGPDDLPGQRHGRGQVEDDARRSGTLAGGDRQVAGRAAEVDEPAKSTQVEGRHDLWRADQPVAVHPHQELAQVVLGPEEAEKIGPSQPNVCCQRWVPSRTASSRLAQSFHSMLFE